MAICDLPLSLAQSGHLYWDLVEVLEYTGIFLMLEFILECSCFPTQYWNLLANVCF